MEVDINIYIQGFSSQIDSSVLQIMPNMNIQLKIIRNRLNFFRCPGIDYITIVVCIFPKPKRFNKLKR